MEGDRNRQATPAGARFEAWCAWCGAVGLGREELTYHLSEAGGLFEFACPTCDLLNIRRLGRADAAALLVAGVPRSMGAVPFELLERRSGPPIGWDDLIDFHEALALSDREWQEVESERDAA